MESKKLYKSLLAVQKLNLKAKKDTKAYNYTYADLEEIWDTLRTPLETNSLVVVQRPTKDSLVTEVVHAETGESVQSEIPLITQETSKNHMQDLGSAITYARRYALASMFNVVTNDDDNASGSSNQPAAKAQPKSPTEALLSQAHTNELLQIAKNKGCSTKEEAINFINLATLSEDFTKAPDARFNELRAQLLMTRVGAQA